MGILFLGLFLAAQDMGSEPTTDSISNPLDMLPEEDELEPIEKFIDKEQLVQDSLMELELQRMEQEMKEEEKKLEKNSPNQNP